MEAWLPLRSADSREERDYSRSVSKPLVAQRGAARRTLRGDAHSQPESSGSARQSLGEED